MSLTAGEPSEEAVRRIVRLALAEWEQARMTARFVDYKTIEDRVLASLTEQPKEDK